MGKFWRTFALRLAADARLALPRPPIDFGGCEAMRREPAARRWARERLGTPPPRVASMVRP